ncbi:OmpA family protein [Alteromonas sp. 1_MG-2023]|uniref:OmpA family protein n=1 Tax=Alteromonas sp. 1_MG-2023 TaxID=3062669 RepID=UPI0026E4167D|nr:OmpA family protein [Alteromonas sp. 1_MG-2023]MDO6568195.1 OmpA family protein [Alteromonas sp. 1_MG-2023]
MEDNGPLPESRDHSLDKIRALILGQDDKYVQEILKRDAKEVVGGIVSEALHERENKDGSVNKVLVPLVEKSLHRSIEANSDKIVGTLYPLVGTLVRKAVSSFLVDFVERTNALIENSLSPKSVSWRFKAWQSGVRYSDYVASQVYQYQVQQLFVIHRETGTLLHTISSDPERSKDADLISSMLVAINDFVADAFQSQENEAENELGEIKTGDFTLLIKIGPQAILVAAVVGSVPPDIRSRLQQALEEFHQFYQVPLLEYQGDSAPFAGCETLLNDCLISAKKDDEKGEKKRLLGGVIIAIVILLLGYLVFLRIDLSILQNSIRDLTPPPGIVLTDTAVKDGKVQIRLLRDPHMQSSLEWLENKDIEISKVLIHEEAFVSLQKNVVRDKIAALIAGTAGITASYDESDALFLSGTLAVNELGEFTRELRAIPGVAQFKPNLTGIDIADSISANTDEIDAVIIKELVARISSTHLTFAIAQENLDSGQIAVLERVGKELLQLQALAKQLNLSVAVFILGASDNSGSPARNMALSKLRANNVKDALLPMKVDPSILFPMGLGQLSLSEGSMGRTVFINVLLSDSQTSEVNAQ